VASSPLEQQQAESEDSGRERNPHEQSQCPQITVSFCLDAVMEVGEVGIKETAAPPSPAEDRARRINDWDRKQEQGGDDGKSGTLAEARDAQGSEGEAEPVGAVVSEIERRGGSIPEEQAELSGRQGQGGEGEGAGGSPEDEASRCDRSEAEGETVETIDEVEGDGGT
jgi:hypothetical protein